jgi:putative ABC transport system ATP-binding protein
LLPLIQLQALSKTYTDQVVLDKIDLEINVADRVALLGSSGSGKSTLLNLIGLLDTPSYGDYFLSGKSVNDLSITEKAHLRNHQFGYVFQQFHLINNLTVFENIALPLRYRGLSEEEIQHRVEAMLDRLQFKPLSTRYPLTLSGGQKQRVAIARALVGSPTVILADEPTGALDSKTADSIMDLLLELQQNFKAALILVTHDERLAAHCSRRYCLQAGQLCSF